MPNELKTLCRPSIATLLVIWGLVFAGVAIAGARAALRYQTPGPFDENRLGFCDFHNGLYFPTLAWLHGDNPYSEEYGAKYPVMRQIPLYSPMLFVTHLPVVILPLHVAEGVYFLLMVLIQVACAWIIVDTLSTEEIKSGQSQFLYNFLSNSLGRICLVGFFSILIVFSRAGPTTMLSGYFTLELALATLLVFRFAKDLPWVAAFALSYSSIKPTFAIPLGIILLSMGYYRVVIRGTVVAAAVASLGILWMAINAPEEPNEPNQSLPGQVFSVVNVMLNSQEVHREQNWSKPVNSWTRIDLLAIVAKWTGMEPSDRTHLVVMLILLARACLLLHKSCREFGDEGLLGLTASLAIVTLTVCLYRHAYDAIPLLAAIAGAATLHFRGWKSLPATIRVLLVFLLGLPLVNYSSPQIFLLRFSDMPLLTTLLTSFNGIGLAFAWAFLLIATKTRLHTFFRTTIRV